ncbi:MAG: hypothetical protein WCB19_09515 [Thermoplasmata archaeon]
MVALTILAPVALVLGTVTVVLATILLSLMADVFHRGSPISTGPLPSSSKLLIQLAASLTNSTLALSGNSQWKSSSATQVTSLASVILIGFALPVAILGYLISGGGAAGIAIGLSMTFLIMALIVVAFSPDSNIVVVHGIGISWGAVLGMISIILDTVAGAFLEVNPLLVALLLILQFAVVALALVLSNTTPPP